MAREERRTRRRQGGLIAQAKGFLAKVDALVDQFEPEEIEEFINGLEEAFPQATHSLSLLYALTKDIKPEDIDNVKERAKVLFKKLDANNDNKITMADIVPLLWSLISSGDD